MTVPSAATESTTRPVTCGGCSLACDDLPFHHHPWKCPTGEDWRQRQLANVVATPTGAALHTDPIDLLARCRRELWSAQQVLITGLRDCPSTAVRAAVALAESLGAILDPARNPFAAAWEHTRNSAGGLTCTLGEVATRATLLWIVGVDPARHGPRLLERLKLTEPTRFLPGGRVDRTIMVTGSRACCEAWQDLQPDLSVTLDDSEIPSLLAGVHAALGGRDADLLPTDIGRRLTSAGYTVCLWGEPLPAAAPIPTPPAWLERAANLLNGITLHPGLLPRFKAIALPAAGQGVGAFSALAARVGAAQGLKFAAPGSPPGSPVEVDAERYGATQLLAHHQVDAVVHCGGLPCELPPEWPGVLVSIGPAAASPRADFWLPAQLSSGLGLAFVDRCDGLPVPLRPLDSRPEFPDVAAVLNSLIPTVVPNSA